MVRPLPFSLQYSAVPGGDDLGCAVTRRADGTATIQVDHRKRCTLLKKTSSMAPALSIHIYITTTKTKRRKLTSSSPLAFGLSS